MRKAVIDSSVIIKWYVEEEHSRAAQEILRDFSSGNLDLLAPDLLFPEVDVVEGQAMISFMRQLRDGFTGRGVGRFPVSVALVGMRDLRDYLVPSKEGVPLNPGSPCNIKEDSVSLCNFTPADLIALTGQHTKETGQVFNQSAIDRIFRYTSGQPWLVNALCKECVLRVAPTGQFDAINAEHVDTAKEELIQSRSTHIDSLAERLKEDRVKRVIFDRRPKARTKSWEERLIRQDGLTPNGRTVKVVWG